jgi:hypothetical protein
MNVWLHIKIYQNSSTNHVTGKKIFSFSVCWYEQAWSHGNLKLVRIIYWRGIFKLTGKDVRSSRFHVLHQQFSPLQFWFRIKYAPLNIFIFLLIDSFLNFLINIVTSMPWVLLLNFFIFFWIGYEFLPYTNCPRPVFSV